MQGCCYGIALNVLIHNGTISLHWFTAKILLLWGVLWLLHYCLRICTFNGPHSFTHEQCNQAAFPEMQDSIY